MATKSKTENPFVGRWRIVSMSAWDNDYLDEEVEAFIEFKADQLGEFQFGYVQGQIDFRTTNRGEEPAVEFTWEGGDGAVGTPLAGRGWAVLRDDELHGEIFIHLGDDSEFVAKSVKQKKPAKRRK